MITTGTRHGLSVGDKVTYTNPQGCVFPGHTIVGFAEPHEVVNTSAVFYDSDSPWFPVRYSELQLDRFDTHPVIESTYSAPCPSCQYDNLLPRNYVTYAWQVLVCGNPGCSQRIQFRGWDKPRNDDPDGYIIQSRAFPLAEDKACQGQ